MNPRRPLQLREYRDRTLYTTWGLSYERLENEDRDTPKLLSLLAFFDHQKIWFNLLKTCAKASPNVPQWLHTVLGDTNNFENAMSVLVEHGFLTSHFVTQSYAMHHCVHDWTVSKLNDDRDTWEYRFAFIGIATLTSEIEDLEETHLVHAPLARHAARLTQDLYVSTWDQLTDEDLPVAEALGHFLSARMKFIPATVAYEYLATRLEHLLGAEHVRTVSQLIGLSSVYLRRGQMERARELYDRAVATMDHWVESPDPLTAQLVLGLSIVSSELGELDKAETLSRKVLAIEQSLPITYNPKLRVAIVNIGNVLAQRGDFEKAEKLYEQSLQAAGSDGALVHSVLKIWALAGSVSFLVQQNKVDEAECRLLQARADCQQSLEPGHMFFRTICTQLGLVYHIQGKLERASDHYKEALVDFEESLQGEESDIVIAAIHACRLFLDQGALDLAERYCWPALERIQEMVDTEGWYIGAGLNYARLLYLQGYSAEAEPVFDAVLEYCLSIMPDTHDRVLEATFGLALVYENLGRFEEAGTSFHKVLAACEAELPAGNKKTIDALRTLARFHHLQGAPTKAEKFYKRALREAKRASEDRAMLVESLTLHMASFYREQNRNEDAEKLLAKYPLAPATFDYAWEHCINKGTILY